MCPGFYGVGLLDFILMTPGEVGVPRSCPPEFRRKVLDLLKAGRKVAHDLRINEQTIYTWRRRELVDTGQEPGLTSVEKAEPATARRRIAELETELAVRQRAPSCSRRRCAQKPGSSRSRR
jgi:transposase